MKIDMNAKLKASGMRSEHLLDQFLKAGYNPSRMADSEDIHGSEYPCIERSLLFPPEFIYGLTTRDGSDVIPFTSDIAVASTTLYNGRLIREAMKKAALKEYKQSCSFQVAAVGLTLMGRYPKPAATCYVNEPCMSSLETFRTIAREQGTPFHELDVPRIYNKEAAIYVEKRLAEIAREIERETSGNIKMDFVLNRFQNSRFQKVVKFFLIH